MMKRVNIPIKCKQNFIFEYSTIYDGNIIMHLYFNMYLVLHGLHLNKSIKTTLKLTQQVNTIK